VFLSEADVQAPSEKCHNENFETCPVALPGPQANIGGPQVAIHIKGGNHNKEELAGLVERRISEIWNRRTHDLETDIA
jgi:hypothetical protein